MRAPRVFFKDSYFHLITRSNQTIFTGKRDYLRYIENLSKYSKKFSVKILAFALMPNHVHLLVQQLTDSPLSKFVQVQNTAYVNYFNLRFKRYGSLFQSHFRALMIDSDEYLVHVSRYIHLNPSSAQLVLKPEDYFWSSYRIYLGLDDSDFVDKKTVLTYFSSKDQVQDYRDFVASRIDYQKEISLQKLLID